MNNAGVQEERWRQNIDNYHQYVRFKKSQCHIDLAHPNELLKKAKSWQVGTRVSRSLRRLRDPQGRNFAHYAVLLYGVDGLSVMEDNHEDSGFIHALDADGNTPLHYLGCSISRDMAPQQLTRLFSQALRQSKLDLQAKNRFKHTVQNVAIAVRNDVIRERCESEVEHLMPEHLRLPKRIGRYSEEHNDVAMIKEFILRDGMTALFALNLRDKAESSLLHLACQFGRYEIAQFLLQHGANVNALDADGNTPLHIAMMQCVGKKSGPVRLDEDNDLPEVTNLTNGMGLAMINLLLTYHADVFYRNRVGLRACDIDGVHPTAKKLVEWKIVRYSQKYNPDHNFKDMPPLRKLEDKHWSLTLAKVPRETLIEQLRALARTQQDSDVCGKYSYAKAFLFAARSELNAVYPDNPTSFTQIAKSWHNHHLPLKKQVRSQFVALIRAISGEPEGLGVASTEALADFNRGPYDYVLWEILKGHTGAIKAAKKTIMTQGTNPNGLMMQYLSHLERLCRCCIEIENAVNNEPGYRPN